MKRDPSIHVTKSTLENILKGIMGKSGIDYKGMTNEVFRKAKAKSIHTRTITVSNDKVEKKAKKLMSSSRADADFFAQLIYARRKLMKHRGISQIKPGGRDWETLKEVAGHALEFSEEFNIEPRKAFILYIDIGLKKMKKFMLNKYLGMYESICETHQAMVEIQKDPDPFVTEQMYNHYNQFVIQHTGIHNDLKEIPERYVYFVRARKEAENLNISIRIYLDAQFSELDFTKSVPHPAQLVGIKARERVMRHCYKNNIKVKGSSPSDTD